MKDFAVRCVLIALCAAFACSAAAAAPTVVDKTEVAKRKADFIAKMVAAHGFDRAALESTLQQVAINAHILEAISKPAERVVPWYEYRRIFLGQKRIDAGAEFWRQHAAEIAAASRAYGVQPETLVAILGVETYFGQRMGSYRVLDALGTLAFAYPPRADFFASELESLLLISRKEGGGVLDALGSYAGAMGASQFMPSSFRAYAVDADGDGHRDLWHDWNDILASVANYLDQHGWQRGGRIADRVMLAAAEWGGRVQSSAIEAESAGGSSAGTSISESSNFRLDQTVGELRKLGYRFSTAPASATPAGLITLEGEGGKPERWAGYANFGVIMRYNHSPKYALAVYELGEAIRAAYTESRAK